MRVRHRLGAALAAAAISGTVAVAFAASSVAAAPSAKPTLDAATEKKLSAALDQALSQVDTPGVMVGVRVGNRTWKATRGVSDTTTKTPATTRLYSRVGSVTKTFTGTLILQLVDQGKLSLDDTIDKWFPDVPLADQITVRMLGDMSSGIDSYTADDAFTTKYFANPEAAWTPQELVAAGVAAPRKFEPGKGFFYSNTNFVMLGLIIEDLTNQPFSQALQQRILDPLKLRATSFPDSATLPNPSWRGYTNQLTTPDGQPVDATAWSPTAAAEAGQLQSNLADMMTWAKAVGTGATLTKRAQKLRLQPNLASKSGGREYDFAIGQDHGWIAHDGDIPGFNSQLAYLPTSDATIIVMTNSDITQGNGPPPAPVIFKQLASVLTPSNIP
jgi:D-alanyl-D-alanine carboxypeptidase